MKFYKISTFVLAVAVIALTFKLLQNTPDPSFDFEGYSRKQLIELIEFGKRFEMTDQKKDLIKYFRAHGHVDPDLTGKMISVKKAQEKMVTFHKYNSRYQDYKIMPSGFAFGKNMLKKFILSLDKNDAVAGVRMYITESETAIDGINTPHYDLLMVPVKADGTDFYEISVTSPKMLDKRVYNSAVILNTSSPCPNICNDKSTGKCN